MANPQAENGHVDISNEVLDALISHRISGEEMQCLLFIIRKTWGWKKKEDRIALSQFAKATGIKRQNCYRAIKNLETRQMISVIKNDYENINSYSFIKDFDKWKVSSKLIIVSSKLRQGVIKNDEYKRQYNKRKNTPKENVNEEFDIFYKAYPVHIGRSPAEKSWNKNGRPSLEIILSAIEKQKLWRSSKKPGEFRPEWKNPATWLNQKCWDDEVEDNGTSGPFG
jgi:phage replication O-like protein O